MIVPVYKLANKMISCLSTSSLNLYAPSLPIALGAISISRLSLSVRPLQIEWMLLVDGSMLMVSYVGGWILPDYMSVVFCAPSSTTHPLASPSPDQFTPERALPATNLPPQKRAHEHHSLCPSPALHPMHCTQAARELHCI